MPPVASAVRNRSTQKSQNHGANAVATPVISWMNTAITKGTRRPYLINEWKQLNRNSELIGCKWWSDTHLSANVPNRILPTKIPNIKIVCDRFGNCACWHTKFHVIWIVSSKMSLLNSYSVQFAEHLSVDTGFLHLNSTFGAMKIMLIWCQATGNFSRNITPHTNKCHLPKCPIAFWIGSDACNVLLASGTLLKPPSLLLLPFASISIATIQMFKKSRRNKRKSRQ